MLYLIGYDLLVERDQDPPLFAALKKAGAKRVMENQWLFVSPEMSQEVFNRFRSHIDAEDRLLVAEITKNSAFTGLFEDFPALGDLFDSARG